MSNEKWMFNRHPTRSNVANEMAFWTQERVSVCRRFQCFRYLEETKYHDNKTPSLDIKSTLIRKCTNVQINAKKLLKRIFIFNFFLRNWIRFLHSMCCAWVHTSLNFESGMNTRSCFWNVEETKHDNKTPSFDVKASRQFKYEKI